MIKQNSATNDITIKLAKIQVKINKKKIKDSQLVNQPGN